MTRRRSNEYRGALCDRELLCHVKGNGGREGLSYTAGGGLDAVCHSEQRGSTVLVCSCSKIGQVNERPRAALAGWRGNARRRSRCEGTLVRRLCIPP